MKQNYVAIDLGATSGRVILAQVEDKHLQMNTLHRFPTPLVNREGRYFWDIEVLFDEIVLGLTKAPEAFENSGEKIESIGIDAWGVDFCHVSKEGKVSMPRAYRDPYTEGVPGQFFRQMPREELYRRTGIQIMDFNSVFQLYAQKNEGLPAGDDSLLFVPDALSYLLTGNMVCEYTILSTSALMDPRTRQFDHEILQICGARRENFPQIVFPGHRIGTLKKELARRTGLGEVPVVAVAGHDTASAVAAVPARGGDWAYLSSGTWSLMGIETPQPVINDFTYSSNYTNEGGATGNIRLLKNITGMWLLEQCLERWRSDGRDYSYEEVTRMAQGAPPSPALIDPDAREFASPTDMPAAVLRWCSANGIAAPMDDAAMIRLIYDSLAAKYSQVFSKLEEIAGRKIKTLHIIGGGSRNALLNQMTSDACGVDVVAGPAEGTALGNIMIQSSLSREDILDSIETTKYHPNE